MSKNAEMLLSDTQPSNQIN